MKVETKFDITDCVIINGDTSVKATVQRISFSKTGSMAMNVLYEVSWFDSSGSYREHYMYEWQLEKVER